MKKASYIFCLLIVVACGGDEDPAKSFVITGRVTENDQGLSGITLLLDDVSKATTDNNGAFKIEGLTPGTYVVKPQETGRTFTPEQSTVTLTSNDAHATDFVRVNPNLVSHGGKTWTHLNPSAYTVKQNSGVTLQLDLAQNVLWYNASRGGLLYQSITGNFIVTATVNAVRKSNNAVPVACNVCLGGIMARNPGTTSENYVHVVSGFTPNGLGFEYKNTTDGNSLYVATPDGNAKHDLRIQRVGTSFIISQKLTTEATWKTVASYNRVEMPATLMVGVNIYTAAGGAVADLSVIYENIVIEQ